MNTPNEIFGLKEQSTSNHNEGTTTSQPVPYRCHSCGTIFHGYGKYCVECYQKLGLTNNVFEQNTDASKDSTPEHTLSVVVKVVLWVGIICSIVLIISGSSYLGRQSTSDLAISLLIPGILVLLSSIVLWAVLKVLCNMSNNLREINQKTK